MTSKFKWTKRTLSVLAMLGGVLFLLHCTGALSARELSSAMASQSEDWFDVDGGEEVNEEPPAEDTDGTPMLQSFSAPASVGPMAASMVDFGQPFPISINYDAAEDAEIQYVLLHVTQANHDDEAPSYIRVPFAGLLPQGGSVQFNAQINNVADLPGNAFVIRLALQGQNGLVGNWVDWNTVTEPDIGEVTRLPMCPEDGESLSSMQGCYSYENPDTGESEMYCYTANIFLRGDCSQVHEWDWYMTLDEAFRSTNIGFFDIFSMGWPAGTRWRAWNVWVYDYETMESYAIPFEDCWIEVNCHDTTTSMPFSTTMFTSH